MTPTLRSPRRALPLALALAASAFVLAGCTPGTYVGGGTVPSTDGVHKATFGINATVLNSDGDMRVNGSYGDGYASGFSGGVKLTFGGGLSFGDAACESDPAFCGFVSYTSTNKRYPGSGVAFLSLIDNGTAGPSSGDSMAISACTGPYGFAESLDEEVVIVCALVSPGYANGGPVTGNVKRVK